jgi:Peptidase family C25
MFVSQTKDATWQDFAFLAAVPASRLASDDSHGLIALEETGAITPEIEDYIKRLKPSFAYHVGTQLPTIRGCGTVQQLSCNSAEQAAIVLATKFWTETNSCVICGSNDYASALIAATVAARLKSPLFYCGENGLSPATEKAISSLRVKKKIFIGSKPANVDAIEIKDATAAILWLQQNGHPTKYLAVANVRDRTSTTVRKLSLVAPMFAAARQGMVIPLDNEIRWRKKISSTALSDTLPRGLSATSERHKKGILSLPEGEMPFVLSCGKQSLEHQLFLDLNGDGHYDGAGEGPHANPSTVTLFGKKHFLDAGSQYRGEAELYLTTGSAADIIDSLKQVYQKTSIPLYLCLVGFPDALPHAILSERQETRVVSETDINSDLPYANADDDLFAEIAVGRIIAESASFATLHASRTITYNQLLDPSWARKAGQARWETTLTETFKNVGLNADAYHPQKAKDPIPLIAKDSPLTKVAFFSHTAHSTWQVIGETYDMHSDVLLAPAVVESGGCLTCAIDYEPEFRSVVSHFLRNGAISFTGNSRVGIAEGEHLRQIFWNEICAGRTLGHAHLRSLNSMASSVITADQTKGGPLHYQLYIHTLFGDPAFKPDVPAKPRFAPARSTISGSQVTVRSPVKFWPQQIFVPEDWKLWAKKPLYVLRGAGTFPTRSWCGEGFDQEKTFVNAEFTTSKKLSSIAQITKLDAPLGWDGKYSVDVNKDGTSTYRWKVCVADFDQKTGKILKKVDQVNFQLYF